jgi:hypothetical protein
MEEEIMFCGNCGWEGPVSDCVKDIYNEGRGHIYCPSCDLSI